MPSGCRTYPSASKPGSASKLPAAACEKQSRTAALFCSCVLMTPALPRRRGTASVELPRALRVFGGPAHRVRGDLGAATKVELGEDARDVVLGGARADHQPLRDPGIRAALCEQAQHLVLASRERRRTARPRARGGYTESAQQTGRCVGVGQRTEPLARRERELALAHRRRWCRRRERTCQLELRPRRIERQLKRCEQLDRALELPHRAAIALCRRDAPFGE